MSRYFPSRVDRFFYLTIVGVVLAVIVSGYTVLVYEPDEAQRAAPLLAVVAIFGLGLPLWLLFSTGYTLEQTRLLVKSGPFSWEVPVREIHSITPTRNPLSSPALSLDRLMIEYGKGRRVMISPADKEGFMRELETLLARYRAKD